MTRDDLIRLAVECQLVTTGNRDGIYMDALERFAHAVAQAELDALKASVPAKKNLDDMHYMQFAHAKGWNDCIDAMTAPKPGEKE